VSRIFKDIMKRTKERPNALMAATQSGLIDTFQRCNATLEHVQNNLESYLELKRSEFPRFYFLSSDALLEILSQTKNPQV
jgi:dynein heavy chain